MRLLSLLLFYPIFVFADFPPLVIERIENSKEMIAVGRTLGLEIGQVLSVKSQSRDAGLIGYVRVVSIDAFSAKSHLKAELIRNSQYNLIRVGDGLVPFDLSSATEDYFGSTELLVRERAPQISSRFKPLFTQGISIGETAQTLWRNEFLFTWYGLAHFGLADWLSIGTLIPGNFFNAPNANMKVRLIDTALNTVATGLSFAKVPENGRWLVNLNLMWDSFSNEKMVSHTFITLAIYSIEKAEETTAIKSAGTSTIQSGYEYILSGWSRILFGPNYNVETKAIGGYFAYAKIWDRFHLQGTLYSTNIRNVKWSTTEGYFAYFDAYWRF